RGEASRRSYHIHPDPQFGSVPKMPQKKIKKTSKVTLTVKLLAMNDTDLKQAIIEDARPCYPADQPWKPVEIEGAFNLARRRHTFVRAGTGSCKSRVAKVYCHLFAKTKNPVVLVLNPLDALGTNQVQEKIAQGFTAINLKQTNFNKSVAGEILPGKYNFIYLSPEIFLNNKMFTGNSAFFVSLWIAHYSPLEISLGPPKQETAAYFNSFWQPGATIDIMRAVNEAQGIDNGHKDLYSTLIRRYHACTGNMDKEDTIGEFKKEDFPVISCTMALGLAQNWKRVRRVITMGQGDPSCIGQMMGRCGRDGRPGLAILFKEKKRKYGYIPMDRDDPNYLREEICEEAEGFSGTPEEAELLLECMKITTVNNFGSILDHPKHFPNTDAARTSKKTTTRGGKASDSGPNPVLDRFAGSLVKNFNVFFRFWYKEATSFLPSQIFSGLEAHAIANSVDSIKDWCNVEDLIGGEAMDREAEMLYQCVVSFRGGGEQERHKQDIQNKIDKIHRIPKEKRLSKEKKNRKTTKRKPSTAGEVAENKRRRAEEKIERDKKTEKEEEEKARKWAENSAFLESQKVFHGTGSHRASGSRPSSELHFF
ncbi:hypothetical protein MJO28_007914, partial [Puccinia striiformis f. sp. tritici]